MNIPSPQHEPQMSDSAIAYILVTIIEPVTKNIFQIIGKEKCLQLTQEDFQKYLLSHLEIFSQISHEIWWGIHVANLYRMAENKIPLMWPEYDWQEKLSIDAGNLFDRLYTLWKQGKLQKHFQSAWADFQEAREQLLAEEQ